MQIYTSQLSDAVTTAPSLNQAYIGHPEVLERVTKRICEENCFYFTGMALGYGRYATSAELKSNNQKLMIGNDNVTWAVQPRFRQLVTLQVQINSGTGGGNAAFTATFGPNDNWLQSGMIVKYTFGSTGTYVLFLVQSGPVANGSNWDYQFKIVSSATTTVPANIVVGSTMGYTSIAQSTCTTSTSYMPKKYLDIYKNYNTTMKPKHTLCKDGLTTITWFKSDDGQLLWTPREEYQFDVDQLQSLEYGLVYNESTVDANGTVYMTDASGNPVMMGDGLLAQISSGNNIVYDVNTYYQNNANYQAFLNQLEEVIENWAIAYSINKNCTLYFHCGKKAYGLLQSVLKEFADTSGGANFVFNYRTGEGSGPDNEMLLSKTITRYKWSSFTIVLLSCAIFDDPGVHGTAQTGVNYLAPPLESFRFVVAPDTDCEGYPLMQLFFRGAGGFDDVWNSSYTPGTISPAEGYIPVSMSKSKLSVTDYSGYDIKKEIEYNLIVRDNSKFLNFTPYQA
jgi:hypothetical protein